MQQLGADSSSGNSGRRLDSQAAPLLSDTCDVEANKLVFILKETVCSRIFLLILTVLLTVVFCVFLPQSKLWPWHSSGSHFRIRSNTLPLSCGKLTNHELFVNTWPLSYSMRWPDNYIFMGSFPFDVYSGKMRLDELVGDIKKLFTNTKSFPSNVTIRLVPILDTTKPLDKCLNDIMIANFSTNISSSDIKLSISNISFRIDTNSSKFYKPPYFISKSERDAIARNFSAVDKSKSDLIGRSNILKKWNDDQVKASSTKENGTTFTYLFDSQGRYSIGIHSAVYSLINSNISLVSVWMENAYKGLLGKTNGQYGLEWVCLSIEMNSTKSPNTKPGCVNLNPA